MELEGYWERYLTHTRIQQNGALSNLGDGIPITTHGIDTRPIAWPGNGFLTESDAEIGVATGVRKAAAAAMLNDIITGRTETPRSTAAVTAIGIMISVVAVLETHMLRKAVASMARDASSRSWT